MLRERKNIEELSAKLNNLNLPDLIDIDIFKNVLQLSHPLTGMSVAVTDLKDEVLIYSGVPNVCTQFHSSVSHPSSNSHNECDKDCCFQFKDLTPETCKAYSCKNNLQTVVSPIFLNSKHIGNIFFSQFLYEDETPDLKLFRSQAKQFGYDEASYLDAIDHVPRFSREKISLASTLYVNLAQALAQISYDRLVLSKAIAERTLAELQSHELLQRLQLATASANIGIWDWDVLSNKMIWDERMFDMYGITSSTFVSTVDAWTNALHPDDKDAAVSASQAALNGEKEFDINFRIFLPDGKVKHIKANAIVLRGMDGKAERMIGINTDVTEHMEVQERQWELSKSKEARIELERALHRLKHVQGIAHVGDWDRNVSTDELTLSDEIYEIWGLVPGDPKASYSYFINSLHPDDKTSIKAKIEETLVKGTPLITECRIVREDGKIQHIYAQIEAKKDQFGRPLRMVGTVQDVTELKEKNMELSFTNAELLEANKQLESFNSAASHDLRSPLNSILRFAQIIQEDHSKDIDLEGQTYLAHVINASKKMGKVIDGLSEISRITRMELKREKINLSSIVRDIANELQTLDPKRTITFHIQDDIIVSGDSSLLMITMTNLMNNAYKFTSQNPKAVIEFGLTKREDKDTYFLRDNGVGFDMRHINKLFQPFERLHGTDEFPGTGIGLATVHRIIKRHDGKIWAESQVNVGTTFYFSLSSENLQ